MACSENLPVSISSLKISRLCGAPVDCLAYGFGVWARFQQVAKMASNYSQLDIDAVSLPPDQGAGLFSPETADYTDFNVTE